MTRPEFIVAPITHFAGDLKIDDVGLNREFDYFTGDCGTTTAAPPWCLLPAWRRRRTPASGLRSARNSS